MATTEINALLITKDEDGNIYIIKPVTSKDNIEDLEAATQDVDGLMSAEDKKKLDTLRIGAGIKIVRWL